MRHIQFDRNISYCFIVIDVVTLHLLVIGTLFQIWYLSRITTQQPFNLFSNHNAHKYRMILIGTTNIFVLTNARILYTSLFFHLSSFIGIANVGGTKSQICRSNSTIRIIVGNIQSFFNNITLWIYNFSRICSNFYRRNAIFLN